MRKLILIGLLFAGSISLVFSQGIRGEIQDSQGEPVPYAAIFIKELTRGTVCNALGKFSLPLPPGTYTIFFRSLGYTEVTRTITLGEEYMDLEIQLPPQTYMIPEVRVSASGEDPAYWIMRKTIGLANYHLNEVSNYDAEIYIKGTAFIEKMPRAIARRIEDQISVKEDQAYMLESLNEVEYTAPDKYEMRVIASQNTLPGYTQNVNPMDYINASLYQEQIESFVSPLARNAFTYYRFSFEGTYLEGTYIINKIKVTPKRKSQQLCEGFLYIVEDLWCLHSSDLSINTIAGTIYLQQLYANVIMDAWLPVNHKIQANVEIAGVKGSVTYVSSLEYSEVTLNPNLPETYFTAMSVLKEQAEKPAPGDEPVSREQEKINELLKKEELTNRDVSRLSKLMAREAEKADTGKEGEELNQTGTTFSVAEDAVKNDSLYWNRVRPIPLTPEEHVTLVERDSIMGLVALATAGDTSRVVKRRKRPMRTLLLGKTYRWNFGQNRFTYGGLLDPDMLGYNTVDGLYYGQDFRLQWKVDSLRLVRSRLKAGYAIHRNAPRITWNSELLYAPMARGKLGLYLSYITSDFNGGTGIPPTTNLLYTLILRENQLRMYEKAEATLYNRIDLVNGLVLNTSVSYSEQRELRNHADFSILFSNRKDFYPNVPAGIPEDDPVLDGNRGLFGALSLEITPKHYYVIRNNRKDMRESRWPTLSVGYRFAYPVEETGWAEYSVVDARIYQSAEVGLLSQLDWSLGAGYFLNRQNIHFSQFKHFKSSPLLVDMARFDNAHMIMDYYEGSTGESWVEMHANLTSSYLAIKFLPWFSERLWKETIGVSYLYTPHIPHYMQVGYSLRELFFLVDLGVYAGFQEWTYKGFGVRINFRF